MSSGNITPETLWLQQHISNEDVDYDRWDQKIKSIRLFADLSGSCIFTVDVFKRRYDFASENFAHLFGYDVHRLKHIREQDDYLEERFHPADRKELTEYQIEHGQFIYSLEAGSRNDYRQIFQFRIRNVLGRYVNVISRHQVVQQDKSGKAWIVMGIMDMAPDQSPAGHVKRSIIHIPSGEIITSLPLPAEKVLSKREKEILLLIRQGFLSKEIAATMNISIHTVNNHRKNILTKLNVNNAIEAIRITDGFLIP